VSFRVCPGEVVALVGPSGAGKSTIAQLVPRLYDPQVGEVRIDGRNIRDFTVDSLRRQISLVLQDTILFRGSVAHNIGYGRAGAGSTPPCTRGALARLARNPKWWPSGRDNGREPDEGGCSRSAAQPGAPGRAARRARCLRRAADETAPAGRPLRG